MRFRNLRKWDDPTACQSLLYFAQILDEMLFDFSLDTYKASVMHTGLLCWEAIQTVKEVEAGNIKAPNVWHVTAELCANFERDPVARALVPLPLSAFLPVLKNPKTPLKELTTVLELLRVQLSSARYRSKNEELLAREVQSGHSIPEVRRLARSYMTTLISTGFSQRYLQQAAQEFFYSGKSRIGSAEAINDFFALFPKERREFIVVFRLHDIFEHVSQALAPLDVKISRDLPAELDLGRYPSFAPDAESKLYGIVSKIGARDVYGARFAAERIVKLCSTLVSLFHHKESPSWLSECIVYDEQSKAYRQVRTPINSMQKCSDLLQPVASKRLQSFMNEFSLERDSFSKFVRSAQLHSMALRSDAEENQILNLWISLESLVPSETKGDDVSNIEHIVTSVVPFLSIGYLERLLNNLVKDLLRWNSVATKRALRAVPGLKFTDKLVKLLALSQFDAERLALEDEFREFHLLRDRSNTSGPFSQARQGWSKPSTLIDLDSNGKLEGSIGRGTSSSIAGKHRRTPVLSLSTHGALFRPFVLSTSRYGAKR